MLPKEHEHALKTICDLLSGTGIKWALTGSASFRVQGMALDVHDIDIQTNRKGAYDIGEIFKDYTVRAVSFSSTDIIQSHFGQFRVNGVIVEVMGDIQKKHNGAWEEIIDLSPLIQWHEYKDMLIPVLDLKYECGAYRKIGRTGRADEIEAFINRQNNPSKEGITVCGRVNPAPTLQT